MGSVSSVPSKTRVNAETVLNQDVNSSLSRPKPEELRPGGGNVYERHPVGPVFKGLGLVTGGAVAAVAVTTAAAAAPATAVVVAVTSVVTSVTLFAITSCLELVRWLASLMTKDYLGPTKRQAWLARQHRSLQEAASRYEISMILNSTREMKTCFHHNNQDFGLYNHLMEAITNRLASAPPDSQDLHMRSVAATAQARRGIKVFGLWAGENRDRLMLVRENDRALRREVEQHQAGNKLLSRSDLDPLVELLQDHLRSGDDWNARIAEVIDGIMPAQD